MLHFGCVQTRLHIQTSLDAFRIPTSRDAFVQTKRVWTPQNVAFWMRTNASSYIAVNAQKRVTNLKMVTWEEKEDE